MKGKATGTMTFEAVRIESEGDGTHQVTGEYMDSPTILEVPHGALYIGGLKADALGGGPTLLTPSEEDGWVWAHSTGEELYLSAEKPPEADE